MFFPTSPRPPRAMILQLSAMGPSLSGWIISTDKGGMRPSRSFLATIGLGLAMLAISLAKLSGVSHTAFALFLAAVILVELFEESDRERSREPMQWERFR